MIEAMGLCGSADALVQGGVVGVAGEMLEHYMQAVVAGMVASGQFLAFVAMGFGSEERREQRNNEREKVLELFNKK